MVLTSLGEGQSRPHSLFPTQTKPSCMQCYRCRTLSWTPNSLILIKHATRAIWHLLCLRNIKWKRNIYDQKQPLNSLLLPRVWNPFFFANNNASLLHLAFCNIAGNSQKETVMWIAAVQFKAKQTSDFRGSGWTEHYPDTMQSCKHFPDRSEHASKLAECIRGKKRGCSPAAPRWCSGYGS